jgi:restriction endonuclease-like protein
MALLRSAQSVSGCYNENGCTARWRDNILTGFPVDGIEREFRKGAGKELDEKMCAAYSSAALVVNTFGPWYTVPASLRLDGVTQFSSLHFEETFPIWPNRTPPHLDLLADGEMPVVVESKCTEWMTVKHPVFSSSYDSLSVSHGHSVWFEQMRQLRKESGRYQFLDAAQLIKHAFGLMSKYGTQAVRLVYVYWEPRNEINWPECKQHRAEADDLAAKVNGSSVRLICMSYRDLWAELDQCGFPDHLKRVRARYDVDI